MKLIYKLRLYILALLLGGSLILVLPTHASFATEMWYVSPSGSDSNDCLSSSTSCRTIGNAIGKAASGDTINVATGTYTSTTSEVVLINKSVVLSGGWDNATFTLKNGLSIVDGEKTRQNIIVAAGTTVVIDSFLIRNGFGATLNGYGGGINNSGTLTLDHVDVSDNAANSSAGGIYNTGTLVLNKTSVTNNQSYNASGGGIYNNGGDLTLVNSTLGNNSAVGGSGVFRLGGGGIFSSGGVVHVYNSTISYNNSGGINAYISNVIIRNSILAENRLDTAEANCQGTITSSGYNLLGNTANCAFISATGDITNVDPNLALPVGSPVYYPLLASSWAIDAGNPAGCTDNLGSILLTDERGKTRVGRCDIGSYEYTFPGPPASIVALSGTPQHARPLYTFAKPLQAMVLDSDGAPISNTLVIFTGPSSGSAAIFSDTRAYTTTSHTNAQGIATSAILIANSGTGNYTVTATVTSVTTPANFLLGNVAWYVALIGVDTNDCQTSTTPCRTITGALTKTERLSDDTILVASGTYTGTGDQVVSFSQGAVLSGGWNTAFSVQNGRTVIDGEKSRQGIKVNNGVSVSLDRFTIQNGSTTSVGGGIENLGSLTIHDSQISRNSSQAAGGGIANYGILTIINCTIDNNTVSVMSMGGGVFTGMNSTLTVINSTISGNQAIDGDGGGIAANGDVSVGIFNSTISQNNAQYFGGGIFYDYNTITLRNSILTGNTTPGAGSDCGGINGQIMSLGHNLIGDTTGCSLSIGTGDIQNTNAGLLLFAGSPGIYMLLPNSPAIDAGDPAGCVDGLGNPITVDERGFKRPVDGNTDGIAICDIGAFEFQALEASYKTVNASLVQPGQDVTYTIILTNVAGGTVETNVTITDIVPVSLTYQIGSLVANSGIYGYNNGTITWTGAITQGTPVSIVFATQLDPLILGNVVITNSVAISDSTEIFSRSITFKTFRGIYLPIILRNY